MAKRLMYTLKLMLVFCLVLPLLAACGDSIKDTYPLESVTKNGAETSYIYRAENQSVPEVARQLADNRTPAQMSKEDADRMFLVYNDELVNVQKDTAKPSDSLIEVDSKEYVRNNYASDFLQAYFTAQIIGSLFDSLSGHGTYRGYTTKDVYKPRTEYHAPTEQEKKATPPMTVSKTGSITKRSTSGTSSKSTGSGSIFQKDTNSSSSTGTITRNGSNSSGSSSGSITSKSKPRKASPPKTKSKTGTIIKRR